MGSHTHIDLQSFQYDLKNIHIYCEEFKKCIGVGIATVFTFSANLYLSPVQNTLLYFIEVKTIKAFLGFSLGSDMHKHIHAWNILNMYVYLHARAWICIYVHTQVTLYAHTDFRGLYEYDVSSYFALFLPFQVKTSL